MGAVWLCRDRACGCRLHRAAARLEIADGRRLRSAPALWTLLYVGTARPADLSVVAFITAVTLAVLAFVWLGRRREQSRAPRRARRSCPASSPRSPPHAAVRRSRDRPGSAVVYGAAFIAAMVAVALYRRAGDRAAACRGRRDGDRLHPQRFFRQLRLRPFGEDDHARRFPPAAVRRRHRAGGHCASVRCLPPPACGMRAGSSRAAASRAATWAAWGVAVPLVILFSVWLAFGNLDRDLVHAARCRCARRRSSCWPAR